MPAPKQDSPIHTHQLPSPDTSYCSCCRKGIIHNLHNVIRIDAAPEKILSTKGDLLGTKGEKHPKAYYHAECFQKHHYAQPGRIECEKCGIFSMATSLRDGTLMRDHCKCSCHSGKDYCSVLIS